MSSYSAKYLTKKGGLRSRYKRRTRKQAVANASVGAVVPAVAKLKKDVNKLKREIEVYKPTGQLFTHLVSSTEQVVCLTDGLSVKPMGSRIENKGIDIHLDIESTRQEDTHLTNYGTITNVGGIGLPDIVRMLVITQSDVDGSNPTASDIGLDSTNGFLKQQAWQGYTPETSKFRVLYDKRISIKATDGFVQRVFHVKHSGYTHMKVGNEAGGSGEDTNSLDLTNLAKGATWLMFINRQPTAGYADNGVNITCNWCYKFVDA